MLTVLRARLLAAGYIRSREVTYLLFAGLGCGDFEAGSGVALFDASVTFHHLRDLTVTVGQMSVGLDRQQPIPSFVNQIVDRSPVIQELAIGQDVGLQVGSNDLFGLGNRLKYNIFVGAGEGRNQQVTAPMGLLYVARIELSPFGKFDEMIEGDLDRSTRPRLTFGFGAGFNQNAQRDRGNQGPRYTLGGFDYVHGAADMTLKFAGLSVIAEALVRTSRTANRVGVGADGMAITESSRTAMGAFVQAGYMTSRFVELSGRYSRLMKLKATDPALEQEILARGQEVGGCLTWYVFRTHGLKLQADYFYQFGSVPGAQRHQGRLQLQVSF